MGRLSTNDRNVFGQNFDRMPTSLRSNQMVAFRANMDALRKRYELNHPLVFSVKKANYTPPIQTSQETNLPQVANEYSRHGKAWFS